MDDIEHWQDISDAGEFLKHEELLFSILKKLEEIRCGLIDVETAINEIEIGVCGVCFFQEKRFNMCMRYPEARKVKYPDVHWCGEFKRRR